jgi:hypothetical protein
LKTDLATADPPANESDDLVDWTKLKGVPAGFADGDDAVGSSGAANNTLVERVELAKPPNGTGTTAPTSEVLFDSEALGIVAECHELRVFTPQGNIFLPWPKLYVVAKEPDVQVWINRFDGLEIKEESYRLGPGQRALFAGREGGPNSAEYGRYFVDAPSGFMEEVATASIGLDPVTQTVGDTCRISVTGLGKEVSPTGTDTLGTAANQQQLSAQQVEEIFPQ